MKITKIIILPYEIKLKEPFIISLGKMTHARNVLVQMKTDEGLTGYGECSPFLSINGESHETAEIVGNYLAKRLLGKNPLRIEACIELMDSIIYGNTSIKSAFDMALYDLAAQHAGLPLYQFLGGKQRQLYTDYTVSLGSIKDMIRQALWIKNNGFPAIKIKLGENPDKDILRVKAIRKAIGYELPLRLDANQGWDFDGALKALRGVEHEGVEYCEEPIPRWAFMELPRLSIESPVPIMSDESCSDHHDAERLIRLKACPMFNIKLGKSGGLFNALKIIQLSEENGIDLQIGGFLESRLAFSASAHLALSSKQVTHCDFDTPLMFEEDPMVGGISYGANGEIFVPETPGLGIRPIGLLAL